MVLKFIKKFIPKPLFSLYHLSLAFLGNVFYFLPSRKLFLIGVTGTKGKTTTAYFIYQLLQKRGYKSALTSTTFFAVEDRIENNVSKMGMPGRFFLPRFLKKAREEGVEYAVVETTSEGIVQHRQLFLKYDTVVFTSLSPEHIERHGSFEAYRKAKEKLFEQCGKTHILNLNDEHIEYFLKYPARQKWGVILDKKIPDKARMQNFSSLLEGVTIFPNKLKIKEWNITDGKKELAAQFETGLPFPGKFNATNLLLAFAAARTSGVPFDKIAVAISKLNLPPGRMQELKIKDAPFRIFIDYAHEPLSLKSALEACRETLDKNMVRKLICLTGAQGGGRDKWKRKVMGRIAAESCNYVIIGTEDPYEESPNKINREVLEGVLSVEKFQENKNCWQFTNRREAIKKALGLAGANDTVILCGKGGEKFMCVGNKKIPWDEEKEVREVMLKFKI